MRIVIILSWIAHVLYNCSEVVALGVVHNLNLVALEGELASFLSSLVHPCCFHCRRSRRSLWQKFYVVTTTPRNSSTHILSTSLKNNRCCTFVRTLHLSVTNLTCAVQLLPPTLLSHVAFLVALSCGPLRVFPGSPCVCALPGCLLCYCAGLCLVVRAVIGRAHACGT